MVDIEQVTYDVLSLAVPGVKWSAEYPQKRRSAPRHEGKCVRQFRPGVLR